MEITSIDLKKETQDKNYQSELVLITKNAGITAFGFFFLNIISFSSNALLTRYLGVDQYGLFVLATRIFDFILIISTLGFANAIVRYVAFYSARNDHSRVKGTIYYSLKILLPFSVFILLSLFFLGEIVSEKLFGKPELTPLIKLLILTLPFSAISIVFLSVLNGLKQIKLTVIIKNFINPSIYIFLVVFVMIFNWGLVGIIWMHVIVAIIASILAFFRARVSYLKKKEDIKPIVEKKELWNFARPLLFIQLFNNTVRLVPIFIMGTILPNSELGIFNVSFKIALLVSFSLDAFYMIFAPVIAELFSKNDRKMIERLNKTVTKWIFSFSLVVFYIILLFTKPLLMIFGNEFIAGFGILIVIASSEVINSSVGLAGNIILMSGRSGIILYNAIFSFLLTTVLCLLLIPGYGALGAAISLAISVVVINIIKLIELYYFEKIHPFKPSFYKPLLSGSIAFLLVYFTFDMIRLNPYIELAIGSISFFLIFILSNWLLKLDDEDNFILNTLLKYFKR